MPSSRLLFQFPRFACETFNVYELGMYLPGRQQSKLNYGNSSWLKITCEDHTVAYVRLS